MKPGPVIMRAEKENRDPLGLLPVSKNEKIRLLRCSRKGENIMKKNRRLSFILAIGMLLQAILIFPGFALAEEPAPTERETEDVIYLLTFVVDGKVAQSRYAPAGEALGPLPEIWVSDGAVLSSWQSGEDPVSAETIATSDMVLVPQGLL